MLSTYELTDERWIGRFYQAEAGRKERVLLAARSQSGWQVWEAVAEYNVARVPGAHHPAHLLPSYSLTHLISKL